MQHRRARYVPLGYTPPIPRHGRLVTQTGVVIGGALPHRPAANQTSFEAAAAMPDQCKEWRISAAVGVLALALVTVLAVGHLLRGLALWSSWAQFHAALAALTAPESLLLAACTAISLLPPLMVGLHLFNTHQKGQP